MRATRTIIITLVVALSFLVVLLPPAAKVQAADPVKIDFNDLTEQQFVGTHYPGLTFSAAWRAADHSTGGYNTAGYPPHSWPIQVWTGTYGHPEPWSNTGRVDFDSAVSQFGGWFCADYGTVYLDAYDAGGALLASNSLGPNYGSSSYLSVSDAQGRIKYVIIHDTSNYWSVDDLEYTLAAEVIITISATEPIIPRESRVENGRVLYQSTLTITARNTITQAPVAGLSIQVQSDRPQDTIIQPTEPTNDKGVAKARIQTREKGTATISGATSDISAAPVPTTIAFNDANYEQRFRLTLYVIADENDWGAPYVINPCGLTGTYSRTFLREVRENGSGRTSGGQYIQIDWLSGGPQGERTCYTVVPFPTTASGVLLEEGMTIAVDHSIIPTGSDVNIGGIGTRTAQDTGGAIVGYRIDLYVGVGETAMQAWEQWNLQWLTVRYVDP